MRGLTQQSAAIIEGVIEYMLNTYANRPMSILTPQASTLIFKLLITNDQIKLFLTSFQ